MPREAEAVSAVAVDDDVEPYLRRLGVVFATFLRQDSGCRSFGVDVGGQRLS
jgi:hypothetical protein